MQQVRESEWESREFAKARALAETEKQLVTPYYDVIRVKADESDDDKEEVAEQVHDFLSPFLPKVTGTLALTRPEALKVREDCLKALKDRLIERANIIQVRLLSPPCPTWPLFQRCCAVPKHCCLCFHDLRTRVSCQL